MIKDTVKSIAASFGFADVFMLKPLRLERWQKASCGLLDLYRMPYDIVAAYPDAKAVALLVWAYKPFYDNERISPYYLASNRAYFAAKEIEQRLNALGIKAKRAELPIRALCLANGIGTACKSGLLALEPYGTRIMIEPLIIEEEVELSSPVAGRECAASCTACINACPMGAINQNGLDVKKCMRFIMETGYTDEVRKNQATFLGCELCQTHCPKNAHLEKTMPSDEIAAAFELRRLITGDAAAARRAVGKNITTKGRLTAEAIAFGAREGLFEQEIRACLDSPFEQVKSAALWAIKTIQLR